MKKILIAVMLSLSVHSAWAFECNVQPAQSFITFPVQSFSNYVSVPERACLNGKDITNWIAGGDTLTSTVKVDGVELFYITTKNKKNNYFQLIAVIQLDNGRVFKQVILQNNPNYETTPKESLQNIVVNHYDENNSTLYFSTNAWAQSDAIHAVKFAGKSSFTPLYEKFLTAGNFVGSSGNSILVQKINHDNEGMYLTVMEINPKGEEICQINTQEEQWKLLPHCLKPGEILKER
ncbi:hypothetical protein [Yersinia pseudotuberculosis]|uniref:hypothetical protein n=1 Tax=Yersinia pseudotuberculosis TaxID=633 RepID=UPI0005AD697D|nr:hypothetical protein [Yersinia pseudotuberculosis]AJJ70351.1 hypothetical protein BZ23_712 [Yersinia pseudotuberculosis]CNK14809.1 Uncharacterised protein [Yersinia pseudotuberculosis]